MTNAIQSINSQHTHRHTEHKLPAERKTIWSGPRGESKKQTESTLSSGVTFGIWDPDHPSDCWSSCSSSLRFREFDGSAGPPRHPQQRLKGAWINKSTWRRRRSSTAVTKTREKMPLIGADMTLQGINPGTTTDCWTCNEEFWTLGLGYLGKPYGTRTVNGLQSGTAELGNSCCLPDKSRSSSTGRDLDGI